ncbi:hypothetical protein, partial [Flavobacterium psychrophilum]|uniref:hypothetical protein n=1 Tax=Flavobacterium psychrophilum TaxID=96345 RepID=UPI003391A79E
FSCRTKRKTYVKKNTEILKTQNVCEEKCVNSKNANLFSTELNAKKITLKIQCRFITPHHNTRYKQFGL